MSEIVKKAQEENESWPSKQPSHEIKVEAPVNDESPDATKIEPSLDKNIDDYIRKESQVKENQKTYPKPKSPKKMSVVKDVKLTPKGVFLKTYLTLTLGEGKILSLVKDINELKEPNIYKAKLVLAINNVGIELIQAIRTNDPDIFKKQVEHATWRSIKVETMATIWESLCIIQVHSDKFMKLMGNKMTPGQFHK